MIVDKLKNAEFYYGLNGKFEEVFEYLKNIDLEELENGKYVINGDEVFAIVQDYQSKPLPEGKWEAHRKYIDVQYVISGRERMGYLNITDFTPTTEYDEEKDLIFGNGEGDFVQVKAGYFAIFTPEDAHMPSIAVDNPEYVKKVVVKVRV